MNSDQQALLELCGIVDSLAGRTSVEQIARLKYELFIALERRIDGEQHLHAWQATLAASPPPSEAVQRMLDTCAHVQRTSREVVGSLAELGNWPPALLPPVRP
jgi:hypothetical protein